MRGIAFHSPAARVLHVIPSPLRLKYRAKVLAYRVFARLIDRLPEVPQNKATRPRINPPAFWGRGVTVTDVHFQCAERYDPRWVTTRTAQAALRAGSRIMAGIAIVKEIDCDSRQVIATPLAFGIPQMPDIDWPY